MAEERWGALGTPPALTQASMILSGMDGMLAPADSSQKTPKHQLLIATITLVLLGGLGPKPPEKRKNFSSPTSENQIDYRSKR